MIPIDRLLQNQDPPESFGLEETSILTYHYIAPLLELGGLLLLVVQESTLKRWVLLENILAACLREIGFDMPAKNGFTIIISVGTPNGDAGVLSNSTFASKQGRCSHKRGA